MQARQLQYQDVSKKCDFVIMAISPETNLNKIPENVRTAFVLYKDYLYYIDKDANENKCVPVKIDSKKLNELKFKFKLNDIVLIKDEIRIHIDNMSSEQFETVLGLCMYFPTWMHKIVFFTRLTGGLQRQIWEMEVEIRTLEERIAKLEGLNTKKFLPSDLEKIYPSAYKKTTARPTDYKVIKLEELKSRIDLLDRADNMNPFSNQQVDVKNITQAYTNLKLRYLACVDQYQSLDKQLSDYSKEITVEDNNRRKCRADVNNLPLAGRIAAISNMPGAISLSILMDIFSILKLAYEQELRKIFPAITGKNINFKSFEDLFEQVFNRSAKDYYKEFAKKPTLEMTGANEEFKRLNNEFWKKINVPVLNQEKYDEFNACFLSAIYLSSTYETFRFTDKVQRLDVGAAIWGFMSGDNVAGEFLNVLSATQIQNSFAIMPHSSTMALPSESTYELWLEAVIWLHGFHQRAFSQISPHLKEQNSVKEAALSHLGDDDDRQFFENKAPLVKWTIAQYHSPHCITLLLLLPPKVASDLLPCLPNELQNIYKVKYGVIQQKQKPLEIEIIANPQNQIAVQNNPGANNIQSPVFAMNNTVCLFQSKPQLPVSKGILPLEQLMEVRNASSDVKFARLKTLLLQNYELTEDQNLNIESIKPSMLKMLDSYLKGSLIASYAHFLSTYIVARTHSKEVTIAYNNINASNTPRMYLLELVQLWQSITRNSTEIGPNTEKMLLDVLILMGVNLEEKQELKNSVM